MLLQLRLREEFYLVCFDFFVCFTCLRWLLYQTVTLFLLWFMLRYLTDRRLSSLLNLFNKIK
jgi:hypothetical protein